MSAEAVDYDPLKAVLGRWVSRSVFMRRLFYTFLGMFFLRQWHVRKELKRIARAHKIRDIFDAGSGYGQYTYLMGKVFPGARIHAVDVKDEQIADGNWFTERVRQKNTHFEVGDLTTFVKPDSFDLALSVDVMEHILEDEAVYRNVFASLRSGGVFVISTPTSLRPESHQDVDSVIGEHVRVGYTREEFTEKMKRAGFVIERMKSTYCRPFGVMAWMILQRIPMRLLSLSRWLAVIVIPWLIVLYLPAALCMFLDVNLPCRWGGGWLLTVRKS
ncbi:class I SAM-dependent methyltransferase [candidate division KSB1 bacterium]|nr:MAG: class I SAM-dependent methyltransferase [candidate division KSB1 bacterium]